MATIRELAFPLANYPVGIRTFGPRAIPDDATEIYFEFARCTDATPTIWAQDNRRIKYDQEVSYDGGVTWRYSGGFGCHGGIHVRRDGTQASLSTIRVRLRPGTGRQLRITITISGGSIRTTGSVELRDTVFAEPRNPPPHNSPTNVDADSTGTTNNDELTTPTLTCSGSNVCVIGVAGWGAGTPPAFSALKWGGVGGTTMTQIGSTVSGGDNSRLAMAHLEPSAGDATIYCLLTGSTDEFGLAGSTWSGVDGTTPIGTPQSAGGYDLDAGTVTTPNISSATGETVVDGAYTSASGGTITKDAGQTLLSETEGIGGYGSVGTSYKAGAATVTMSWAYSSGYYGYCLMGVPLKPAAAGGSERTPTVGSVLLTGNAVHIDLGIRPPVAKR